MRENWTNRLPSLLEEHQEAAPEGLWDAVQAGITPAKPRTRVVWWPWVTGVVAAAAAVVLAVFLWKPAPVVDAPLSAVPEELVADLPTPAVSDPGAPKPPVSCTTPAVSARRAPKAPVLCTTVEERNDAVPQEALPEPVKEDLPVKEAEPVVEEKAEEAAETAQEAWPEEWPEVPAAVPARKSGRLQLTLTSGGALLAQSQTVNGSVQGYGVPYNPGMGASRRLAAPAGITTQMLSRNRESQTEAEHRRVLRVSLGVNYGLAPRLSIGSGLTYSILRSDYTTLSGSTETQTTRYMHYLGVPLNLQFNLLDWRRLSLYVNAGPMLETAVAARVDTRAYVSGQPASLEQETVPCKDWRWSLNAGAGVQFRLFRGGALFVQPGLSWHIPKEGGLESCYSARPLAFELDFGFRILL